LARQAVASTSLGRGTAHLKNLTNVKKTIVILKGYPRLSETFIAQELRGLERAGMDLELVSLRRPTDTKRHPVHDEIRAPVHYLPEYLHDDYARVVRALFACLRYPGLLRGFAAFLRDFNNDCSRNRVRRLGQALVLAAEMPKHAGWLHAHFIHTPASVTAYASLITGLPWSCSAHAKDIWTSPDWDLQRKLARTRGAVTCTRAGYDHLRRLAVDPGRVHLSYHGLDLQRFGHFDGDRSSRDGTDASDPVVILSVGRAVPKKGYDILLKALAILNPDVSFRFIHVGGGEELERLTAMARALSLEDRIAWKGALAQGEVLALYRQADIFALACRISKDGDRDGLPNVLVEASSQGLVCVSTDVSGVPELLSNEQNGLVVASENPDAFADALLRLTRDPALRRTLGAAAEARVRRDFDHNASVDQLMKLFRSDWHSEN
jgi:glycosyltransferase involved in cell wall biosynthesis